MENFPGNCIYIFLNQRLILATAELRKNFSRNIVAILLKIWIQMKFYKNLFLCQNIFKFKQYCRNVGAILFNIPAMFRNLVAIFRQYCLSIRCYGGWRLNLISIENIGFHWFFLKYFLNRNQWLIWLLKLPIKFNCICFNGI